MRSEHPQVMRDQVLGALGDPGQIAHAKLLTLAQRRRQRQTRRVRDRPCPLGGNPSSLPIKPPAANLLSPRKVYTQKVAVIVSHKLILTYIDMLLRQDNRHWRGFQRGRDLFATFALCFAG